MRPFLALVTGFVLLQAPVAKAYDEYEVDAADEVSEVDGAEYFVSADVADPQLRARAGWNRWTCTANGRPFNLRLFRGSSYWFRDGSGEGQEAKRVAQKIAIRNCEYAGLNGCTSDLTKCTVE